MQEIKIDINKTTKEQIDLIVDYFQRGKVIVYPTDTIYGLGCLATNKKAIEKIYKIKQRSKSKPLLILISGFAMLKKYCYVSKRQYNYLHRIWPGPVSVILNKKKLLPNKLINGETGIAVRLPRSVSVTGRGKPKNNFLIKIIRRVGKPIVSTSFNISGKRSLTNTDDIEKYFKSEKPDLVVDAGELKGKPSKLIDIRDIDNTNVLRN